MGNLGFQELLVIGVVLLLVMGPKRLPEIAKAIGEAVRAFQDSLRDVPCDPPKFVKTIEHDDNDDRSA